VSRQPQCTASVAVDSHFIDCHFIARLVVIIAVAGADAKQVPGITPRGPALERERLLVGVDERLVLDGARLNQAGGILRGNLIVVALIVKGGARGIAAAAAATSAAGGDVLAVLDLFPGRPPLQMLGPDNYMRVGTVVSRGRAQRRWRGQY
jgi:hypothetical protein